MSHNQRVEYDFSKMVLRCVFFNIIFATEILTKINCDLTMNRQNFTSRLPKTLWYLLISGMLLTTIYVIPINTFPPGSPWPFCKKLPKQPPVNQPLVSSLRIYSDIIDIV